MGEALPGIGARDGAEACCRRAERVVPAYGRFLRERGWRAGELESRPLMDKASYIARSTFADLVGDDVEATFAIVASSGSSGRPHFWPQLKQGQIEGGARFRRFLESGFGVDRAPTIAVVGLALGSWIGGDMISFALKSVAATTSYPLAVFVPGSRHEEILRFLSAAEGMLGDRGRFVLFVCPSAIGHLHLLAENLGVRFPHERVRYAVLGEAFPEEMRISLRRRGCCGLEESPVLSVYGSADTGVLGAESPASALARTLLHEHPEVSERLGLSRTPPHLFHVAGSDVYVETVDSELCVTRWQGVPLMRYNLHDRAVLLRWSDLLGELRGAREIDPRARDVLNAVPHDLPDLVCVFGRADRCLILCGTNLSEDMLGAAVAGVRGGAAAFLTGAYRASIVHEDGRQRLAMELEVREGVPIDAQLDRRVYPELSAALGRAQPEFADDWANVYRRWDDDAARRIIRLSFCAWPAISQRPDGVIKARGIVA